MMLSERLYYSSASVQPQQIEKRFVGKVPNTLVSLTQAGQEAITRHWLLLDKLRQGAREIH